MIVTAMSARDVGKSDGRLTEESRLDQLEAKVSPIGSQADALLIEAADERAHCTGTTPDGYQAGLLTQFDVILVNVMFDGVDLAVVTGHGPAMTGKDSIRMKIGYEDIASGCTDTI
jgi:hypothetical protein